MGLAQRVRHVCCTNAAFPAAGNLAGGCLGVLRTRPSHVEQNGKLLLALDGEGRERSLPHEIACTGKWKYSPCLDGAAADLHHTQSELK